MASSSLSGIADAHVQILANATVLFPLRPPTLQLAIVTCETLDKYGRATYRAKIVNPKLKRVLYESEEKGGVLEALVGLVRSTSRKVRFIVEEGFEDEGGVGVGGVVEEKEKEKEEGGCEGIGVGVGGVVDEGRDGGGVKRDKMGEVGEVGG